MIKIRKTYMAAVFVLAVLNGLSGCSVTGSGTAEGTAAIAAEADGMTAGENVSEPLSGDMDITVPGELREDRQRLLGTMTRAIEAQFPEEAFTDIPESETADSISMTVKENYILSGRRSSAGREYIAGVSLREDNPLEGMSCRTADAPVDVKFVTSQFANGRFVLMEKAGQNDGSISALYDLLQTGEAGLKYMLDAAERGVTLIMPEGTPFLRVHMVKNTIPVTEYVPLTNEEYTTLKEGAEANLEEGAAGTLLLCESGEDVQSLWTGETTAVSEEMVKLAREKCGYSQDGLPEEGQITEASLLVKVHGETREETISNREDLANLTDILSGSAPQDNFLSGSPAVYEGKLTLREQDGREHTMHIGLSGESIVLGTSRFAELKEGGSERIWSLFSTIDGWIRYGDKIKLRIRDDSLTEEDPSITFVLENRTGGPIKYILTPLYSKKEGDSYKKIESIAGFCGVTDVLDGEEAELSVPWGGAFVTEGEGAYKLEIQVQPEEEVRFGVSDNFVVKK